MHIVKKYGLFLLIPLFFLIFLWALPAPALPTAAWGLSFPQAGQPPTANVSADRLRQFDAVYVGPAENTIYLTFDAGYENGCTEKILDVLKARQVPAAFFLVGTYLEQHPDLVKRMAAEGHIVGNHTQNHPDMSGIEDFETFAAELRTVEETYFSLTGQQMPRFYRPPQGIYSEKNLEFAKKMGYKTVFWSLAYVDWQNQAQPTKEQAFSKLLPRIHPGAVVLLHATSATNAEILDELLTRWQEMGYRFGTLEELFPL